jgi:hypothetical protein
MLYGLFLIEAVVSNALTMVPIGGTSEAMARALDHEESWD